MRSALILGLIAFLAIAAYGIHRNPRACEKLGLDLLADALAIYTTTPQTDAAPAPKAAPAPEATTAVVTAKPLLPEASPAAAPSLPVVTPVAPTTVPAAAISATPATAPAPVAPKPQFAVGYVASVPSAPATVPQPAPLPPPAPPVATYPTFTDYIPGLEEARKHHVPLLVLFTGSDWCQYCQMLEREVLSTDTFTKFSKTHFVFVTIDDLRNSPVADADKRRIDDLEQKFNITGFPTLLVLDENEHEKGRSEGYDPGSGPAAVIQQLSPLANR